MPDILHRLKIEASPHQVYQALTEQRGLSSWWTRDTVTDPVAGLTAQFGFSGRKVLFHMFIESLEADKKVVWRCLGGHPEWEGTVLTFQLEPYGEGSVLHFTHAGWSSTAGIFATCNFDWARYLISLKEYLTTGRGTPHRG